MNMSTIEGRVIHAVAAIEVLIGLVTVVGLLTSRWLSFALKPINLFIYVLISALASIAIGIGIFNRREPARYLLVFFSGYVILIKLMIFAGLIVFSRDIIRFIPAGTKNYISVLYHSFLVVFFTLPSVKEYFRS